MSNESKEKLISQFRSNQTLTNLQHLKNAGIELKTRKNNQWEEVPIFELPFERFIPLYDNDFQIHAIATF